MGINYSHSKTGHGQDGQPEVGMSFGCTRLSQGDRTYLPASFSPHLHSQGPDDSERKCQLNMPVLV